jgi:hypothetical protein
MIEDDIRGYAFRNTPGYIWIDNPSGEISKGAFANDPNIKYVEMSDNINKIDFNVHANPPISNPIINNDAETIDDIFICLSTSGPNSAAPIPRKNIFKQNVN